MCKFSLWRFSKRYYENEKSFNEGIYTIFAKFIERQLSRPEVKRWIFDPQGGIGNLYQTSSGKHKRSFISSTNYLSREGITNIEIQCVYI